MSFNIHSLKTGWLILVILAAVLWACGDAGGENDEGGQSPARAKEVETPPATPPRRTIQAPPPQPKTGPNPGASACTSKHGPYEFRDPSLFPNPALTLYQLLKISGDSTASFLRIRMSLRGDLKGINFGHMKAYLANAGIKAEARLESLSDLLKTGKPAIILTRTRNTLKDPLSGQCVLCVGKEEGGVRIIDPMAGNLIIPEDNLGNRYLGVNLRLEQSLCRLAKEAPDLICDEIVWSFGEVASGTQIRHSFPIRNGGTRPLKVSRVETTCGCAAAMVGNRKAELSKELIKGIKPGEKNDPNKRIAQKDSGGIIEPGKTAWVSAYVNTLHKQGYMSFRIRIRSDDPEEPELSVSLQGTVVRVFEYEPVTLWFREIKSTAGAVDHLWIRHYKAKPFKISKIKTTSRYVRARIDPNPPREPKAVDKQFVQKGYLPKGHPRNQGWQGVKVEVVPGAPIGTFSATVSLEADKTPIEVNLAALIKGNLKVNPGYFSFGHIKRGTAQKVVVSVSSELGKEFNISKVEVNKDFMTLHLQPGGDGHFQIHLSLKEGWNAFDLQGVVTIHSNDPLEKEKKILVYGFIKRG